MNILDLFSGIGGFHKGLLQAGAKIDWCGFSEIDKYATSVYKKQFPESEELGDVRKFDVSRLPRIDLLCGGFPCQAFSIAGKRGGFEDTRGTLFYDISRICEQIRPKIVFLENVRGLLSHNKGLTFETIIRILGNLGYSIQWQVCNSRYFGVPQNRERVFIVGYYGEGSFREVFPIRNDGGQNIQQVESQTVNSIDSSYYKGVDNHGQRTMIEITKDMPDAQRVYDPDGVAKTLKGLGGGQGAKTGLYKVHCLQARNPDRPSLTKLCECGSGKLYKKCCGVDGGVGHLVREDGSVYCLDTGNTQAVEFTPCLNPNDLRKGYSGQNKQFFEQTKMIRRLTPVECERLQGFPDDWTKYGHDGKDMSDSQRYKMCGNSVTVNVIEQISRKILEEK